MIRPHPHAGFSLIEVMIAILILGIALAGLTRGITTALSSSKESELQTVAALFAQGKMEELRAGFGIEDGEEEGACGAGLENYAWNTTIAPTATEGLHEVEVLVRTARTGQEIYSLRTLLFDPPDAPLTNNAASGPDRKSKTKRRNKGQ